MYCILILQSGTRLFFVGYSLQLCLKSLLQANRIIRKPSYILQLMISSDTFRLGAFLGGFSTIYKVTNKYTLNQLNIIKYGLKCITLQLVSCLSRKFLGKDSKYICIPAGFLASLTYCLYRNNTIALYVMLKSLQVLVILKFKLNNKMNVNS